ncbi:thiamine pyrophosphate-dependent enzyme [Chloroflexota bacterium]
MMDRSEVLKTIAKFRTDEVVIATMSAMGEWPRLSPSPLNLQIAGAMGYASNVGMGIALARPDKRVIVIDGDGSLLMNLGALVTLCHLSPPNLTHFVLENGLYELPGRIPLPSLEKYDMPELARSSGLTKVYEFNKLQDFQEQVDSLMHEEGPIFASLKVNPGPKEPLTLISSFQMARDMEKALGA